MTKRKDAFDRWWAWANKPPESMLMIPGEIHYPVMGLTEEERKDRGKVNEAVRAAAERAQNAK